MDLSDLAGTVVLVALLLVPISVSVWALLDAARRPQWAWALAGRNQVGWMAGIMLGTLFLVPGLIVSGWYLANVRPTIAAAEDGRF